MKGLRRVSIAGRVGFVAVAAASVVLAASPAFAVTPTSVGARTPTYSASTKALTAAGTFVNNATVTATYTYIVQLVRTTGNVKPVCAVSGCLTAGTTRVVTTLNSSISVNAKVAANVSVSATCALTTTNATGFYWTWFRVADSSGNIVTTSNGAISGKYC